MLFIGLLVVAATVCLVMIFAAAVPTILWLRRRKNKNTPGSTLPDLTDQQRDGIWPPPPKF